MVPSLDAVHLEVGRHGNMVIRGRVVSPKAVELINGLDTTWRAGVNKLMNKTMDQIKGMLGARLGGPAPVAIDDDEDDDLRTLSGQRVTGTVP
ncbi:hypothetical protein HDE_09469 [Halotydeus destructor]|nr:hypothetical protein HDE_09469 [Halotydeus destructor]